MKLILAALLIVFASFTEEKLKVLEAKIGHIPNLSLQAQQHFERRDALLAKGKLTEKENQELLQLLEKYSEAQESVWDVIEGGCSWYCGGGPYKVVASSELDKNYKAAYAHDLSFKFAWIEGAKGQGVGEYIEYYFKNDSPRLNKIDIFNGYLKSEEAWKNNSRVKKIKMYINGAPYAMLNLKDTKALQSFNMPLLGKRSDKKDLILKFEIIEVYAGDKFADTALTEIYFDGIDVH